MELFKFFECNFCSTLRKKPQVEDSIESYEFVKFILVIRGGQCKMRKRGRISLLTIAVKFDFGNTKSLHLAAGCIYLFLPTFTLLFSQLGYLLALKALTIHAFI